MKKNITYIVSDVDKAIAFEWIVQYLDLEKINLSFILINSSGSELYHFLKKNNIPVYTINCPSKIKMLSAVLTCRRMLKKTKAEVVHCHLLTANLVGLTAAKTLGIKQRIYTRHHSDYHHLYHKKAVKLDKYCNRLATRIVSISEIVTKVLVELEHVPEEKIVKIWHGFDTGRFLNYDSGKVADLKEKYNPLNKAPVIGIISRATHWKGIQYTIPAYKKVLEKYPDALLLMFNPVGNYEAEINELLKEIPDQSYLKVFFEKDITNLYRIFDMFVHVPISESVEAFGQTYIECMLSGVPLIATRSGIGNDIMIGGVNCLGVPFKNSTAIFQAIDSLMKDPELRARISKNALKTVVDKFSVQKMIDSLEKLYL